MFEQHFVTLRLEQFFFAIVEHRKAMERVGLFYKGKAYQYKHSLVYKLKSVKGRPLVP